MITNPYVPNAEALAKDADAPKVIENPYLVSR